MTKQDESPDEIVVDEKNEYDEYVAGKESAISFTKKLIEMFQESLERFEKAETVDEIHAAMTAAYDMTARIAKVHMMADMMSDVVLAGMEHNDTPGSGMIQ